MKSIVHMKIPPFVIAHPRLSSSFVSHKLVSVSYNKLKFLVDTTKSTNDFYEPKSRYRHSKGLPLLSLRAPEGCVAIPQRDEIASASPRNDYFLNRDLGLTLWLF